MRIRKANASKINKDNGSTANVSKHVERKTRETREKEEERQETESAMFEAKKVFPSDLSLRLCNTCVQGIRIVQSIHRGLENL